MASETPKKYKFPKSLAVCADRYADLKEQRLALEADAKEVKAEEEAIKQHIIDNLPKSQASGIAGKHHRVTVVVKSKPTVEDWTKFYAYIKKTGSFDLLNRAINSKAVQERWDAKKAIPGVGSFQAVTLSLEKV